jgi:hypothetical protein
LLTRGSSQLSTILQRVEAKSKKLVDNVLTPIAVLVWAGPRNLCRRCPKQEASDLSAPGAAHIV